MPRIVFCVLLLVLLCCDLVPATSCHARDVRIAFATWVGYGPLFIARDKDFFRRYGVDVELVRMEDESEYQAAMSAATVDALCNVLDREVLHRARGAPGVVLFALAESAGGDGIVAQPGLDSLADLSGRVVGLHKSSTSYFFFLTALERAGVDEENLRVREMLSEDMTRAFLAGELDAAVTWQPWLERMARRPGAHVLASSRDFPRTIVDVFVMRKQMADDAPQVCMGLARAWFDAVDWMQSHPVEANAIIGDALGIAPNRVADMLAGVRFLGREENREFLARSRPGNIFEVADRAGRFWTQRGFIDFHTSRGFIAPEYVSGALRGPDRVGR